MSGGVPVRVAVEVGAATVRVAAAGTDGEPWLVAERASSGRETVVALLVELIGPSTADDAPEELVLVHPGSWPPAAAAEWAAEHRGRAARVRAVPAPLAAAARHLWGGPAAASNAARSGRNGLVVLDVGFSAAEVTWLEPDGRVRARRVVGVGGRRLDELVAARLTTASGRIEPAEARRVREALSLLPSVQARWPGTGGSAPVSAAELRAVMAPALGAVVAAVRALRAAAGPVLLVGGVARSPLLAELLDEAGVPEVTVAPRPDTAAVLGALVLPPDVGVVASPQSAVLLHRPADAWLGPPVRRRWRTLKAVSALVAAGAVLGVLLVAGPHVAPPPASPGPAPPAAGVLVQYGYRLDVPPGWEHTGGLPERRRVLLTPVAAPEGSDLIAVERTPLGYDSGAEPARAQAELLAEFDAAVAGGSRLSGYDPHARVAGRGGVAYRQEDTGSTVVEWFVVLDADAQLSVGCRHTRANAEAVRAACHRVLASVGRS